jgi:hypothetical protein
MICRPIVYVKQEYQFVDETAKLWSLKAFKKSSTSSISLKDPTPTPGWSTDLDGHGTETPPSSVCNSDSIGNIDPRILTKLTQLSLKPSPVLEDQNESKILGHDAGNDLTSLDEETSRILDREDPANGTATTVRG